MHNKFYKPVSTNCYPISELIEEEIEDTHSFVFNTLGKVADKVKTTQEEDSWRISRYTKVAVSY